MAPRSSRGGLFRLQGYLAHKKHALPVRVHLEETSLSVRAELSLPRENSLRSRTRLSCVDLSEAQVYDPQIRARF